MNPPNKSLGTASDEALMILYQQGDVSAFEVLYSKYKGRVYSFIRKKVTNESDAGEVLQNVFLKLHQSRHTFNPEFTFTQWLFTISRNCITDSYRKQRPEFSNQEELDVIDPNNVFSAFETRDHYEHIISTELKPGVQEVVALRLFNEETFEQISLKLNLSQDNVRQIVSRSFKRLKTVLDRGKE